MAHTFQAGDSVAVIARDATNADTKSGLYYPHFADMRGTVLKIYGEEASILIDRDSLHTEIRVRHEENEVAERKKYAERISEAARNSLSDKEKNFPLQYTILIALKDVVPDADGAAKRLSATDLDTAEATFLAERAAKKKK
ncbi:MAG: hypothetical protein H7Y38_13165 [Armatimonadetes bacterium]|nr:hypothetical protein [Armatimonadota bacterium]